MKYIQRIQTLEILHGVLTCRMAGKETFQYKLKVMVIVQKDTKLKDSQCWHKITVYLNRLSKPNPNISMVWNAFPLLTNYLWWKNVTKLEMLKTLTLSQSVCPVRQKQQKCSHAHIYTSSYTLFFLLKCKIHPA